MTRHSFAAWLLAIGLDKNQTGLPHWAWFKANDLRGLREIRRRIREGRGKDFNYFGGDFVGLPE